MTTPRCPLHATPRARCVDCFAYEADQLRQLADAWDRLADDLEHDLAQGYVTSYPTAWGPPPAVPEASWRRATTEARRRATETREAVDRLRRIFKQQQRKR